MLKGLGDYWDGHRDTYVAASSLIICVEDPVCAFK